MLERKESLFIITDSIIKTRYGFISQPHTPLSGKDLLSHRRHQAALQGLFLSFPFISVFHVCSNHSSLPSFIYLQFLLSPFPSQPALFYFCVFILCRHCAGSHLLFISVLIIAAHMPYPEVVFHSSSPHLPALVSPPNSSTRVSGSCMGWYRCYTFG